MLTLIKKKQNQKCTIFGDDELFKYDQRKEPQTIREMLNKAFLEFVDDRAHEFLSEDGVEKIKNIVRKKMGEKWTFASSYSSYLTPFLNLVIFQKEVIQIRNTRKSFSHITKKNFMRFTKIRQSVI